MGPSHLPHPIPYQGSKRNLAPAIALQMPKKVRTLFEPFAGSAAMTLYAAHHDMAETFVIGDSLPAIIHLWQAIVEDPERTAARYREVWEGQTDGDHGYYNRVRERYNATGDPVDLLYIVCRCVKNAVRFTSKGTFSQSHDKRRLGMRPDKMLRAIEGASRLLGGRTEFVAGDWRATIAAATPEDYVYMDPPYQGTSIGRDKRYHSQMTVDVLSAGLRDLNARGVPFALSYDGSTGGKDFGVELPADLRLRRIHLRAGRSSQATLMGKADETVESLYMSPVHRPCDAMLGRICAASGL